MKVIRQEDGPFELQMEETEWESFSDLLFQYPLTPADQHSLNSKTNPDPDLKESDQWLRDSVSNHQTDPKRARQQVRDVSHRQTTLQPYELRQ